MEIKKNPYTSKTTALPKIGSKRSSQANTTIQTNVETASRNEKMDGT